MTSDEAPVGWWFARVAPHDGQPGWIIGVCSDLHPDGSVVGVDAASSAELTTGWCAAAAIGNGKVLGLRVAETLTPDAPPLWFAELRDSHQDPPATNLVAFTGHGQTSGALHDEGDLSNVAVGTADQLGAVRWYPATGEVDFVYVASSHRQKGIGTALVHAAWILGVARGWPVLWSDGQRTPLGERFRNGSYWRQRAAELTHLVAPMNPDEGLAVMPGRA